MMRFVIFCLLLLNLLAGRPTPAQAVSLIRDAEIEYHMRQAINPLLRAAGLHPNAVRIYIVNDYALNAFVVGGANIFINAGILMRAKSAQEVIGVLAHEIGHITAGHESQRYQAVRNASAQTILALIVGVAAAVAGQGNAAAAATAVGSAVAQRGLLAYTRGQESDADQAAFKILDQSGESAAGMLSIFEALSRLEGPTRDRDAPYLRSHPMFVERMSSVRAHLARSPHSSKQAPAARTEAFLRIRAKLEGFLETPELILKRYGAADQSLFATYARAIAHHRGFQFAKALDELDKLMQMRPKDAFFTELLGQILYENGKIELAIAAYDAAVRLRGDLPLLRVGLAQAQLALENDSQIDAALAHLRQVTAQAPRMSRGWRLLAEAYGRKGMIGMAALATAERYLLSNKKSAALGQARRAVAKLAQASPSHLRALDIIALVGPKGRRAK